MSDIVVAPFSNSAIRDWPAEHFAVLIGLLLEQREFAGRVHVIGTASQRLGVCEIVRRLPVDRVVNQCGRLSWDGVLHALRDAYCVVGNNSGIAHVAGYLGAPTVCVFGGSHQRIEWRPRGDNVILLSRTIGCSPCQLDHGHASRYGKACLRDIAPETVAAAVATAVRRKAGAAGEKGSW